MLTHITIHQRLLCGYALILGLAVAGTTTGLLIGNRYQRHALKFQQLSVDQQTFLSEIQVGILYHRPAKQLSPHLDNADHFQHASQDFLDRIQHVHTIIDSDEELHYNLFHNPDNRAELAELHNILHEVDIIVQQFYERANAFVSTIDSLGYAPETLELAQKEIIILAQSEEFRNYIALSEQLLPFIENAKQLEEEAAQELQRAEQLRTSLILGSLLVSTAIASVVGVLTSRAIANPLEAVTKVAQQVTKHQTFDVHAPIARNDEIGILARSFNQLIQKVNQLLSELQQKNADVEDALKKLQKQQLHLVQSEKMSSLGQLVAGIAHEINNPVNFIHGNLSHLKTYTDDLLNLIDLYQAQYPQANNVIQTATDECEFGFIQDDLPKMLDSMSIGTRRIREIVLSLRNFARMDEADLKPAEIHDGLNNTLLLLQHRIKPSPKRPEIQIVRDYGDIPPIECYGGLLNQVFMNVLANAIDALEERMSQSMVPIAEIEQPTIRIKTALIEGPQGDGKWLKIAIADNGMGMDDDVQKRILNPFFTTKPIGKGTGLGMSIAYQIVVDRHDGQLECHSNPGQGTEFVIKIPIPSGMPPTATELLNYAYPPKAIPEMGAIA
ncbi:MAG: ATP-binding protein [Cyanobacteria bacterium P01_F01_bin.150]